MQWQHRRLIESNFRAFVRDGVHQVLKPHGFKRRGNVWFLDRGRVIPTVAVHRHAPRHPPSIEFQVRWGAIVPEFTAMSYPQYGGSLTLTGAPIQAVIVKDPPGRPVLWEVRVDETLRRGREVRVGSPVEVATALREVVVPQLERIATPADVADLVEWVERHRLGSRLLSAAGDPPEVLRQLG